MTNPRCVSLALRVSKFYEDFSFELCVSEFDPDDFEMGVSEELVLKFFFKGIAINGGLISAGLPEFPIGDVAFDLV